MSAPSIAHQVSRCLKAVTLSKEQQEQMRENLGTASLKKSLRPHGDPKQMLPYIFPGSAKTYFRSGRTFFQRTKEITEKKQLFDMLNAEDIFTTFDQYYSTVASGTAYKVQLAIKHIFAGAVQLGWVTGQCPVNNELHDRVSDHVRTPRYGYHPEDAFTIVDELNAINSPFALPAELALYCGLREDEIAGLMGENVDRSRHLLCVRGKGGKSREVPIPDWLMEKLPCIRGYLFTPKESWCANFRAKVQQICEQKGIGMSGIHRLRATYAMLEYSKLRIKGYSDQEARAQVSQWLGHNRVDVTYSYIPAEFNYRDFIAYIADEEKEND